MAYALLYKGGSTLYESSEEQGRDFCLPILDPSLDNHILPQDNTPMCL